MVCAIGLKYLPLVEQGVDEVRVVVEVVSQTGVGDLKNHLQYLFYDALVHGVVYVGAR